MAKWRPGFGGRPQRWSTLCSTLCQGDRTSMCPISGNVSLDPRGKVLSALSFIFAQTAGGSKHAHHGCSRGDCGRWKALLYLCREEMVLRASNLSKCTFPNEHLCIYISLLWYHGNSTELDGGKETEALSASDNPWLCDLRQGTWVLWALIFLKASGLY